MPNQIKFKGRFVKKKVLDTYFKRSENMRVQRKNMRSKLLSTKLEPKESEVITEKKNVVQGSRIVNVEELANNMICSNCNDDLVLRNIIREDTEGLHSCWCIKCEKCNGITKVHTGKVRVAETGKFADNNTRVVLGVIHSGSGRTALNKLLACVDMPTIPTEILDEIYPELKKIYLSVDTNDEPMTPDLVKIFNAAVGSVVNIIVSYDMGWSKRGNGKSYDSLNGYGTIIGYLSKKILDFGTRNRKCKKCDNGHSPETHSCRKNYQGSAKGMEANVAASLVNESSILKSAGVSVRVVVGDDDSSAISAILQGDAEKIRSSILVIGEHVYGNHENCGAWCQKEMKKHTITLTNEPLRLALNELLMKYACNSTKFSVAATSQLNEIFNGIVAHKMPKIQCHSLTASGDYRVASAVLNFNDGESYLMNMEKKLGMDPGTYTSKFAMFLDSIRHQRSIKIKTRETKRRRIMLTEEREKLRQKNEKVEGVQYQRNCGIEITADCIQVVAEIAFDINELDVPKISDDCQIVYFDLETSGFAKTADILQIAARCDNRSFSVNINPTQPIHQKIRRIGNLDIDAWSLDAWDSIRRMMNELFALNSH
ncbi:hypothetical protein HCN44_011024 [Aphidius gifuensis]|uniref:Mutator-like transposase domain-containing protein n=1 Tax=Aphidius gifuensis TaxID=684658 RepID=A0A834Y5S7_APHGI|nr:hypothetical protein HCN44_011024 [Aphidius gifuensis]